MAKVTATLDSELWIKILSRLEDVLINNRPNGPSNYEFEEFHPSMVDYNIRHLHNKKFIYAKNMLRPNGRHGLRCWPIFLREKGLDFLSSERDDDG